MDKKLNMNKSIRKHFSKKKHYRNTGSIFVDAVICFPLFLIAVITISFLITSVSVSENVVHSMSDEARKIAIENRSPALALKSKLTYLSDIKKRVVSENSGKINGVNVKRNYLPTNFFVDNLMKIEVDYTVPINLPIKFTKDIKNKEVVLFRKFVGQTNSGPKMPFSEMEKSVKGNLVWVFPRAGEKFHKEKCHFIINKPREKLFNMHIQNTYKPCRFCITGTVAYGTLVYCYVKAGEVFHLGHCPLVDKYVISMSKEEAKKKGYTSCKSCSP